MIGGIDPSTQARIGSVLRTFPQVRAAILFGSRAKGTFRPGSDIDLALVGDDLEHGVLGRIDDALDELFLPHRFSLLWLDAHTDQAVAAHVGRVGVPFFTAAPTAI